MPRLTNLFPRDLFVNIVITGFNTDIEFQGTTYHVQTEDKGVKTPLILSLVYDRGTILASKRSTYNDLLSGDFDEKILAERLQKQHNLICAAIRTGRIEDLKRMTAKDSAAKQKTAVSEKETKSPSEIPPSIGLKSPTDNIKISRTEISSKAVYQEQAKSFEQLNVEKISGNSVKNLTVEKNEFVFTPRDEQVWDVPISVLEEPVFEIAGIVEEEFILPAEAVEVITSYGENESIPAGKLKIKLLNDEKFKSGERKTIRVLVNRGNTGKGLSDAQIIVKVLGSAFHPLIFHAKTDSNGVATVALQLPQFKTGRAAMLIKAISSGDEIDLRRAVTHD